MNIEKIEQILKDQKQPKFRLGQIKKAVYQEFFRNFDDPERVEECFGKRKDTFF